MIIGGLLMPGAQADHEPANKVAAAGSDVDHVTDDSVILSERVRVSSSHDLILSTTAECSILTSLLTDDNAVGDEEQPPGTDAFSFGSVRLQILIDGKPVPVASSEAASATSGDDGADDDDEIGEVTFCNRAYQRTVTDTEENEGGTNPNGDGVDRQDDFIRTRTANGFNWLALDVGFNYDEACASSESADEDCQAIVTNGNNIVQIDVVADYDVEPAACEEQDTADNADAPLGRTCADAFVGSRTLIVEPTNASVHEMVNEAPNAGS